MNLRNSYLLKAGEADFVDRSFEPVRQVSNFPATDCKRTVAHTPESDIVVDWRRDQDAVRIEREFSGFAVPHHGGKMPRIVVEFLGADNSEDCVGPGAVFAVSQLAEEITRRNSDIVARNWSQPTSNDESILVCGLEPDVYCEVWSPKSKEVPGGTYT